MEKKYPSERAEKFVVRFDAPGVREALREVAARNRRSMNAEINARLEESLRGDKGVAAASGVEVR